MLSAATIDVIQSTIPLLEEHGRTITDVFYKRLFENHPFLKNIFNMANQGKGEQSRALSDAVIAYAKNIDNLEVLLPTVQRIANKHVSLGVQAKHYDVVGIHLLAAIQEVLNLPDDHAALTAWGEAYGILAQVFINAETEIYTRNKEATGGWEGFRDFYIDNITTETSDVKSFYFKPVDLEPVASFHGGQYLGLRVRPDGNEHHQIRQYSLSNPNELRISVKAETGGAVSNHLHNLHKGDVVSLQAPTGVFTLNSRTKKSIFIAGGIGITPLISMLQDTISKGADGKDLLFVQCARDPAHQIFKDELSILRSEKGFHHKLCYENSNEGDHQGYLNIDIIQQWLTTHDFSSENAQVYFCGPKPFMAILHQFFTRLGFAEDDIHYEIFGPTTAL